jgi:uncharacterized protein DUF664
MTPTMPQALVAWNAIDFGKGVLVLSSADVLVDGFDRIREEVHGVVDGLSEDQLAWRADKSANSIAWLVWHLTRVQDDHIAGVAGHEQVWTAGGWAERFELPFELDETGYGASADDVAAVRADAGLLIAYHDAVHQSTVDYVKTVTDDDLAVVVDKNWNPPVTLSVRLVSVLSDDLQHIGQAAFVRGLITRR